MDKRYTREHTHKPADKKRKKGGGSTYLGSILFLTYLLAAFVGIIVFAALRIYIGMGICFGLFCGTIIISMIVVSALSKREQKRTRAKLTRAVAECVSCTDCGARSDGKNYKIAFIINGHTLYAQSRNTYDKGERVEIEYLTERSATCDIVGEE